MTSQEKKDVLYAHLVAYLSGCKRGSALGANVGINGMARAVLRAIDAAAEDAKERPWSDPREAVRVYISSELSIVLFPAQIRQYWSEQLEEEASRLLKGIS